MKMLHVVAMGMALGIGLAASGAYAQAGGAGGGAGGPSATTPGAGDKDARTGRSEKSMKKGANAQRPVTGASDAAGGVPDASKPSSNNDSGTGSGSTGSTNKDAGGRKKSGS